MGWSCELLRIAVGKAVPLKTVREVWCWEGVAAARRGTVTRISLEAPRLAAGLGGSWAYARTGKIRRPEAPLSLATSRELLRPDQTDARDDEGQGRADWRRQIMTGVNRGRRVSDTLEPGKAGNEAGRGGSA